MPLLATSTSEGGSFVDIDVPPIAWVVLVGLLVAMLAIDLYRHREAHAPTQRSALTESAIWVACGLSFAVGVWLAFGSGAAGEYVAGYLIEKSLSVDNVFVWSMIFGSMAIPVKFQHRVLFWGIFGALTLRALFIGLGTALIGAFWWVLVIFGAFLVFTGIKIIRHRNDEGEEAKTAGLGLLRRFLPMTDRYDGQRFFTREQGRRTGTPLLAALVVIEVSDVIFAVDSVPAILAVSHEPYLVFSSNAFAILGLRAMYFLLADAKDRFHYLSHALGFILVFVGVKMAIGHWFHIPTALSLAVIVTVLIVAIWMSMQRSGHDAHDAHDHTEDTWRGSAPTS